MQKNTVYLLDSSSIWLLSMTGKKEKKKAVKDMPHNFCKENVNIFNQGIKLRKLWNGRLRSTYSATFHLHFSNTHNVRT